MLRPCGLLVHLSDLFPQHDRVIPCTIPGRKQERDRALPGLLPEIVEHFAVSLEFLPVFPPELLPSRRIMTKPFSERGARGNIPEPEVYSCAFFFQPPLPPGPDFLRDPFGP